MFSSQPNITVLLTRIKEVAKVFLATNSDYNYTEVSFQTCIIPWLDTQTTKYIYKWYENEETWPSKGPIIQQPPFFAFFIKAIMKYLLENGTKVSQFYSESWRWPVELYCKQTEVMFTFILTKTHCVNLKKKKNRFPTMFTGLQSSSSLPLPPHCCIFLPITATYRSVA